MNYAAQQAIRPMQPLAFKGFGTPSFDDKFQMGVDALDNGDIFVVTNNMIDSKNCLVNNNDKFGFPVRRTLVLETPEAENPFCVFRNSDKYYVMNLSSWAISIRPGKYVRLTKDMLFQINEFRPVKNGELIATGFSDDKKILFYTAGKEPKKAYEKYIKTYSFEEDKEKVAAQNRTFLQNLGVPQESKTGGIKKITFADIGGYKNTKKQLEEEIIFPMKYPEAYKTDRLNKGVLLYGPPRCGKTMMGLAMANEANAKFIKISANDLTEAHVGKTEQNWRETFEDAMKTSPAIIFIDEFDAVAKQRHGSETTRHGDDVTNQILALMSDLEKSDANVFVIAATNAKKLLDKAMLGTGRFGLHIEIPLPDKEAVAEIFDIYLKDKKLGDDVEKEMLVQLMHDKDFNGSDIAEVVSKGRKNAMERLGIYDKMRTNTFLMADLDNLMIEKADFIKVIDALSGQKSDM
jgi:AAA+ superfamily predicted ATPase